MIRKPFEEEIAEFFAPYYKATFYSDQFLEKVKNGLKAQEKAGILKNLDYTQFVYEIDKGSYKKAILATALDVKEEKEMILVIGEYLSQTPDIERWSNKHRLMAVQDKMTLVNKIAATGFRGNLKFLE